MGHLRFTPAEYRAIARIRNRLDLRTYDPPTVRLILSLSLADHSPLLADRIRRLGHAEIRLLYDHLRAEANGPRHSFTADELRQFAVALGAVPTSARFARPYQQVLVKQFRKTSPNLSRKLRRMSITQFVWLFEQVGERGNV